MQWLVLGVTLIFAAYFDYKTDRIPNIICLAGSVAGLTTFWYSHGLYDSLWNFIWVTGIFLCLFPLWRVGAIGAGDIKLIMTAGMSLGKETIPFLICSGSCIGLHAMIIMLKRKNYFKRMTLFFQYGLGCWTEKRIKPYPFEYKKDAADGGIRITYGLLAGHFLAMALKMYS